MHGFYYLVELVYLKYAYLKKLGRLTLGFPELVQECARPRQLVIKRRIPMRIIVPGVKQNI